MSPNLRRLIGQAVRQLREREGLSQTAYGKRVNLTKNDVSLIENGSGGKRALTEELLARLARGLGITLPMLMKQVNYLEAAESSPYSVQFDERDKLPGVLFSATAGELPENGMTAWTDDQFLTARERGLWGLVVDIEAVKIHAGTDGRIRNALAFKERVSAGQLPALPTAVVSTKLEDHAATHEIRRHDIGIDLAVFDTACDAVAFLKRLREKL